MFWIIYSNIPNWFTTYLFEQAINKFELISIKTKQAFIDNVGK